MDWTRSEYARGDASSQGLRAGGVFIAGGLAALLFAAASVADIALGIATGGGQGSLEAGAAARFGQLRASPLLGLYNLDLLNLVTAMLVLPAAYATSLLLRRAGSASAGFAFAVAAIGAAVFAANNPALPMLGLAGRYFSASDEALRAALIASGEALLARGAHGSPGAFPGFLLPISANVLFCLAMMDGRGFRRGIAWLGLAGNIMLFAYIVLVTFVPPVKPLATAFAAPGGIMAIAWMALMGLRLLSAGIRTPRG